MKKSAQDDGNTGGSAPCFAHELGIDADGAFVQIDPRQRLEVLRWRKAERERLIAKRLDFGAAERRAWSAEIVSRLAPLVMPAAGRTVGFCWPFRGEPDLRVLMEPVLENGGICALPVVIERGRPLVFRAWKPGDPLQKGVWNIPVPESGRDIVPDVVLPPVVGFDGSAYRLGYGGGFFDRTLAALSPRPRAIGVGYECARIRTIFPQPHDIAMDLIVTEKGVFSPAL
ncbi:5-formyltetrahydrofolate cyclo-ligase [Oricola cellulosilytica]|uniref:5-formyltetrahydrofolate cyclo-ligase n=1 Tax=Oricola cellulosilytica TaxID=1429082 RepID=A0A4R0PLU4_9HYPH|nr:5-formyltetrahydrofolate cyclo-ligase [Oricola cellulosilytica]TCD16389.1 5-formyltetrahydrofolate cyclo-ligase [Oricola cellulosilytica]